MELNFHVDEKNKKKKKSFLLRLAFLVVFAYVLIVFVNQQMTISQKQSQYNDLTTQLSNQELANEELKALNETENIAAYVEKIARNTLNFVFPGETIFVNISGN